MNKFYNMMISAAAISVMVASHAFAAEPIKVCTGGDGGVYEYVGDTLKSQTRGQIEVEVINTAGSWENLQKLNSGECDVAITQSDALYVWTKEESALKYYTIAELYTEYAHLLCNRKSSVEEWGDLNKNTKVFTGDKGSGSDVTARGLRQADEEFGNKSYVDVPFVNEKSPEVALIKVKGQAADCLVFVGGKGSKFMSQSAQKLGSDLVLRPIVDKDFNDVEMTDVNGITTSVWTPTEMPYATYTKIMPSGLFGRKDIDTIGVNAMMIVSEKLVETNPDAYASLGFAIEDVMNIVRADKGVELID